MADTLLEQFLIGVGFKIDNDGAKKLEGVVKSAATQAILLSDALEGLAKQAARFVTGIVASFDQLYYAAGRTGSSVQNLKELGFAFGQLGGSSQQAMAAVEGFSRALRMNPGLSKFLKDIGVDTTKDKADQFLDTIEKLNKQPYYIGSRQAEMLGISEENYNLVSRQLAQLKAFREEYRETARRVGLDNEAGAKAGQQFSQALGRLEASITAVAEKIAVDLMPAITGFIKQIQDWIETHPKEIEEAIKGITAVGLALVTAFSDLWKQLTPVAQGFTHMAEALTGKEGANAAFTALGYILEALVIARLIRMTGLITGLAGLSLPAWLIAALGLAGAAQASTAVGKGGLPGGVDPITGAGPGDMPGGVPQAGDEAPPLRRAWRRFRNWMTGGTRDRGGNPGVGGWWTPERQQHAIETLMQGGISELGAKALVARWSAVEARGGPTSRNPKSGAYGIGQWLGARLRGIDGDADFDHQLQHAIRELNTTEGRAKRRLNSATTPAEAARGASMFERAEGYDARSGEDNFTGATERAIGKLGKRTSATPSIPQIPKINATPSSADASRLPVAGASASNDYSRSVNVEHTTKIEINGASDPVTTGKKVEDAMGNVGDRALRNASSAVR